ncbi:MAG TPA: ABC transporter ATP-binding protein [Tepidisphaeraceae bacterium]|nr:ABC transporter ATP-binding protein [Tepidisphaeraceae bacterium]
MLNTEMSPPIVQFRGVVKRFGHLLVLDGVDLTIQRGESIVIIGASGSGKSVMLKHIVGLLRPDAGEVWFDGTRIDNLPERQLMTLRQRVGFLFQMGALFDSLTVGENIAFPLVEHTRKSPAEIRQIVAHRLAIVGLPDIEQKMPAELSGGQRKRVALARAVALEPEIILYDEPTTGLDPIRSDVINELIIKLQRELHTTSVTVTHDMNSALKIANRIVMLHEGKLIFEGTPNQVRNATDPIVHRFVTGEADERELAALNGTSPAF